MLESTQEGCIQAVDFLFLCRGKMTLIIVVDICYSNKKQHFLVTLCLNASTSRSMQIHFPSYIEIKQRSSTIRSYTAAGKIQYHLQIKQLPFTAVSVPSTVKSSFGECIILHHESLELRAFQTVYWSIPQNTENHMARRN